MPGRHGPISTRDLAVHIVGTLRQGGHVAYLAGGCVRDGLLGLTPKDYDVATDARPEAVKVYFPGSRFVGEAFGVVLVRRGRATVEVATFRREWGYSDGRQPDHVEFSDAEHDARRRDFTINGLYEDPLATDPRMRIIDFVGGMEDLQHRLLRAIGRPEERFGEDYLRMLRAVRFAAALGFDLDPATADAIRTAAPNLAHISRERIGQEVRRMLDPQQGPDPLRAAMLMQELHLDAPVLNEGHATPSLRVMTALVGETPHEVAGYPGVTYPAVLAAWALDRNMVGQTALLGRASRPPSSPDVNAKEERPSPQPESGGPSEGRGGEATGLKALAGEFVKTQSFHLRQRWRKALCLTNEDCQILADVFDFLPSTLAWATLTKAERMRLLGWDHWAEVMAVATALDRAYTGSDAFTQTLAREAAALHAEGVAPPPLLTGDDLIALGRTPGPDFKRLLDAAYDAQLEGSLTTREEALAWARTH